MGAGKVTRREECLLGFLKDEGVSREEWGRESHVQGGEGGREKGERERKREREGERQG